MTALVSPAAAQAEPHEARVAVPVADLRKEPSPPGPSRDHDPLEESQLLQVDPVTVLEEKDGWARVEAVEQMEWTHHQKWEGYPGWVRLSDLVPEGKTSSTGYKVPGTLVNRHAASSIVTQRKGIVQTAREFIGTPYYWGGRSFYDPKATPPPHRGVDCSGLTGLAYQMNGVAIPRDAHEQWMKAREIRRDQLKPADLVFLSDPKEERKITHVMLYAGDGRIIEGPGTGEKGREISLEERLKELRGRKVYYGTYLP